MTSSLVSEPGVSTIITRWSLRGGELSKIAYCSALVQDERPWPTSMASFPRRMLMNYERNNVVSENNDSISRGAYSAFSHSSWAHNPKEVINGNKMKKSMD